MSIRHILPHRVPDLAAHRAKLIDLAEAVLNYARAIDPPTEPIHAGHFMQQASDLRGLVAKLDLEAFRTFRLVERFWDEAYYTHNPRPEPQPKPVAKTIDDLI